MYARAKVPVSCGELAQGVWQGEPFLVTCPVDIYVEATVSDEFSEWEGMGEKTLDALKIWREQNHIQNFAYGIRLLSPVPRGKGMASSSADIAAALSAASVAVGSPLTAAQIGRIAAAVEPTDGVFFPGLVRMNHLTGEIQENLGNPPPLNIIVFDSGGAVDTLTFARPATNDRHIAAYGEALSLLAELTAENIGKAATVSAQANQAILPKPRLDELTEFCRRHGALGINVAHSGTVVGILFAAELDGETLFAHAANIGWRFPELRFLANTRLISGGIVTEKNS